MYYVLPMTIRSSMGKLYSFLILVHLLSSSSASLSSNATDRDALLSFKSLIHGDPLGVLSSWNETNATLHFCDWPGVTCGDARGHPDRVSALELQFLNLTGTLSPALANITFLHSLNLTGNNLGGAVPSDLGRLARLNYLDLGYNLFRGEIPPSLVRCTKLRNISLRYNQLSGTIPASLGWLQSLRKLSLSHNQLTGGIPPSLGNLSALRYLGLSKNGLEGEVPDSFGRLTSLEFLDLVDNNLSGEIPTSLFNISSITSLQLGKNSLSGMLPADIGYTLPRLKRFTIFYNRIEGEVPTSLTNASGLERIVFYGNRLVGRVPRDLGFLRSLITVDFGLNRLVAREARDWEFMDSLSNCSNFQILYLADNDLQGVVPKSVANLSTELVWLAIARNRISGSIPMEIGRYVNLTVLEMDSNLLAGNIPSSIGMLRRLHRLFLSQNSFQGDIPSSLGNLTQLNELLLQDNRLRGTIPVATGALSNLAALNLSRNGLTGVVPEELLGLSSLSQYLDLSYNSLDGPLSSQVGKLVNLNVFDVSNNRLTGEIPGTLGGCQLLGVLYMQGNMFRGTIPPTLGALKGIEEVDFSGNNLSGLIPDFFESFRILHYLNLSFNDLEGQVPRGGVFQNTSAVSVLGNTKLCGGNPGLHLQPCASVQRRTTSGSNSTNRVIVVVSVLSVIILLVICAVYCRFRRPRMVASAPRPILNEQFMLLTYTEIRKATNGFSSANLIGAGSFGTVYKGIIADDRSTNRPIAVKVFDLGRRGSHKSFVTECDTLKSIRHRNLVSIVTVCVSVDHNGDEFKALVFDYMPNGSLDDWLHPRVDESGVKRCLSIVQRCNVIMDVACALDYLHCQCDTPVVHADLKPSNVLLDSDMCARVCDFGLARTIDETISNLSQDPSSSLTILGSIGYIAPEYGMGGTFTTRGDVYSFGVLVLETFTGKRPTDETFCNGISLHKYVSAAYPDRVMDITDPSLVLNVEEATDDHARDAWSTRMREFLVLIFSLGLSCSEELPAERMEISDILKELFRAEKKLSTNQNDNP